MSRILITSGPTRQYLDPVRFLTNGSSGRMGAALAAAAIELGHDVVLVSGPVAIEYPPRAEVHSVVSTAELLTSCRELFPACDGMIAAAAPCDYQPQRVAEGKIAKDGQPLQLNLIETPDVAATIGAEKRANQWTVGFALETEDRRFRALVKLERKSCDLIVLNGPEAMDSLQNQVEVLDHSGVLLQAHGTKQDVSRAILQLIQARLILQGPGRVDAERLQ